MRRQHSRVICFSRVQAPTTVKGLPGSANCLNSWTLRSPIASIWFCIRGGWDSPNAVKTRLSLSRDTRKVVRTFQDQRNVVELPRGRRAEESFFSSRPLRRQISFSPRFDSNREKTNVRSRGRGWIIPPMAPCDPFFPPYSPPLSCPSRLKSTFSDDTFSLSFFLL